MSETSVSFEEKIIKQKPDIQKVIESLSNIPSNEPLSLVEEKDFNPDYIHATRTILEDFASRKPNLHLNTDTLLKEYIEQYGIVTEQDHVDCLKLAMRESLKNIKEGKKICIMTKGRPGADRSQNMMSEALYLLLSEATGKNAVEIVEEGHKGEHGIRDSLQRVFKEDHLAPNDHRFVIIDDATYSGIEFYGFSHRIARELEGLIDKPEKSIDAFLAFDKNNINLEHLQGYNVQTVRRVPDPIPVEQIQNFNDDLFGRGTNSHDNPTITPNAIITAYKYPDDHSVLSFYKRWAHSLNHDISNQVTESRLGFMTQLLVNKGILPDITGKISAFGNKQYPKAEYLASVVKNQIGLNLPH